MGVYIVILALPIIYFLIVAYLKKKYSYWSSKGIKGPPPLPFVGNFGGVMFAQKNFDQIFRQAYKQFPNEKVVGLYRGLAPVILIRDPELIKHVLIKDFQYFQDRGVNTTANRFSNNLFALEGEPWKILRQKFTPVFTSGKLKNMVPLVQTCVDEYVSYINKLVDNNFDHEIRSLTAKYTLEVIGSCAFGLNLGAICDEETEFGVIAKKVLKLSKKARLGLVLDMMIPGIQKHLPYLSRFDKDVEEFFLTLVTNIIEDRQGKPKIRKDFMDFMIELREQGKVVRRNDDANDGDGKNELEIDDVLMAAQALIFYAAGFDTSSATMSFLINELALNQDIQERAYKEVCEVYNKYNDQLKYDALKELVYLDMLLDETLRKYPIVAVLFRKALVDYNFPGTDINIKKGTSVFISVGGLHHDPKYFTNPEKFDPEVFSPENRNKIPHNVFLPFGEGPRNCIGMRFAKIQSLMGLAAFIKNFKVEPSSKTKKVLEFDPRGLTLTSEGGLWVKISKRSTS